MKYQKTADKLWLLNCIIAREEYAGILAGSFFSFLKGALVLAINSDVDLTTKKIHLMGIGGAGMSGLAILP